MKQQSLEEFKEVVSKWKINLEGFELYRVGSDREIYRLPYTKGKRGYSLRKIKRYNDRNRWTLNGKPWTPDQLRNHLIPDEEEIILVHSNLPF